MRILIESHPGTTLAKEICLQLVNDKLLTSYKLVLLLMLRDLNMQKISNTEEEVKYFLPGSLVQSVVSYLDDTDGDLQNKLLFRDLQKETSYLPYKWWVTSRPYASAVLHEYMQRRVEVLGFGKEQYISMRLLKVLHLTFKS